jgi:hypothetical protein
MSSVSIINAKFDTTKKQNIPGARKTTHLIFTTIMGINNFKLSPELIAGLYPECLVDGYDPAPVKIVAKTSKPITVPAAAYPYLGKNLRSVCFLTYYPEGEFLSEEQLVFLQKILEACKYSLDDIALVNTANISFDLAELRLQLQPRIIFLWGIPPESVLLKPGLPDYSLSMLDGISVIPVSSPELMTGNSPQGIEFKHRLWACLKKLFSL